MSRRIKIAILSDVHYACAAERNRGNNYEFRDLKNPLLRLLVKTHRHYIWLREPLNQNARLDEFLAAVGLPDWVIAGGDYNCDTNFVGLSDPDSLQSASECLGKLRERFGDHFRANLGDHEFGKLSLFGGRGGMRLASVANAKKELGLDPFWQVNLGKYLLLGVASSLIALQLFKPDILPEEAAEWGRLAAEHMAKIKLAFSNLKPEQRVILFCHDPSALPILWQEEIVRAKISQIEQTIVGHLHSNLILRVGKLLSGIPPIGCLGHTIKRLSTALSQAKYWRPFHVRLCPSLAGIELLKDGGFYTMELEETAMEPARFEFHPLKR